MEVKEFYDFAIKSVEDMKNIEPQFVSGDDAEFCMLVTSEKQALYAGVTSIKMNEGQIMRSCPEYNAVMAMLPSGETLVEKMVTISFSTMEVKQPCEECLKLLYRINPENKGTEIFVAEDKTTKAEELQTPEENIVPVTMPAEAAEKNAAAPPPPAALNATKPSKKPLPSATDFGGFDADGNDGGFGFEAAEPPEEKEEEQPAAPQENNPFFAAQQASNTAPPQTMAQQPQPAQQAQQPQFNGGGYPQQPYNNGQPQNPYGYGGQQSQYGYAAQQQSQYGYAQQQSQYGYAQQQSQQFGAFPQAQPYGQPQSMYMRQQSVYVQQPQSVYMQPNAQQPQSVYMQPNVQQPQSVYMQQPQQSMYVSQAAHSQQASGYQQSSYYAQTGTTPPKTDGSTFKNRLANFMDDSDDVVVNKKTEEDEISAAEAEKQAREKKKAAKAGSIFDRRRNK